MTNGRKIMLLAPALLLIAMAAAATAADDDGIHAAQDRMAAALRHGDADALSECYAEDARLSFPLRPDIIGRDEIRRQMEHVIGLGVRRFEIIQDDLIAGPEFVIQSGTCIFYNETGREFNRSRFVTIWKRDGRNWRIYRDFVV